MNKKLVALLTAALVVALGAGLLVSCGGGNKGRTEIDKLIVGFDQEYPPYGYVGADGEYTGFDLDLAAEVAKRRGWELELQPIDWDAKDELLKADTITCIWNGFTYEGRENDYGWSEPYMLNAQVIVVKADSGIAKEEDLAGKNVITQAGSAAEEVLQGDSKKLADTFGQIINTPDYNNAFMQLEAGLVDAVACDLSIAAYQMAAKPGVYTTAVELSSEHYAVGFKKDDQAIADQVTETLREMVKDGTIEQLIAKYADQGLTMENWCLE